VDHIYPPYLKLQFRQGSQAIHLINTLVYIVFTLKLQSEPSQPSWQTHLLSMQVPVPIQPLGQYCSPFVVQKELGLGQSI
jgi:hypothetical protein